MKKSDWIPLKVEFVKIMRIMRITAVIVFLLSMNVYAESFGQVGKINLKMNANIKEVFEQLEKVSGYRFVLKYDQTVLDKKVDINFINEKIDKVLDDLLKDTGYTYKVIDRYIAIIPTSESNGLLQQQKSVSGKVTDSSGLPLPGVSVVVKGTTTGTITDGNGNYSLSNVSENAILQFSFVGMKGQEVAVGGKATINVTLVEDAIGIEEVVAVGYGTMKKGNLAGAISSVNNEKLTVSPIASTTNSLVGRLPGLISLQSSGQPGADYARLSIRGFGNPLVIVDGIESDFNSIDANQIESVSMLKDGSASIYGARAGNGVLLVTTKRGISLKPTITFNTSLTGQGVTSMPKTASSGQYAEMERETWIQSGRPVETAPFTLEQIQKYYEGGDPQYPNTVWSDELIRSWAPQQQHNLSVRGGSDKIKYYGFIGYLNQESMWKNNGGEYERYNLQSNIDAKILDNLSFKLDISSIVENRIYPASPQTASFNGAWMNFWSTLPIFPAHLPDPTKIPVTNAGGSGNAHVMTNYDLIGYSKTDDQNLKGSLELNYDFLFIKGLSAKAFLNYNKNYQTYKYFQKPVEYWLYDYASDIYTYAGGGNEKAKLYLAKNEWQVFTSQFSLNFDRTFEDDHHVSALALYEAIDYKNNSLQGNRSQFITSSIDQLFAGDPGTMESYGSAGEMGRKSYVTRLNYSYKNKYLLETTLRADASAKFSSENRWGYFPSISAGWVISEENFLHKFSIIDHLKLRASYGESGNDNVGNFQYLSGYGLTSFWGGGGSYLFGDNNSMQGIASTGLANPRLTWEEYTIYNVGLEFTLWNRKLYGEGDVFYRTRDGIPASLITSLPSTFGSPLPPVNLNSLNDRGMEFMIGTEGKIQNLSYNISGNISFTRSKWDHFEEPEYFDSDQDRLYRNSGNWTDRAIGYVSDGLFTSQKEIDNLGFDQDLKGNISLKPGDIRFKDMNGDKILDWKDQQEIGKGNSPNWITGLNIGLKYQNFDFSALLQGAFGYYTYTSIPPRSKVLYDLRWTETNNDAEALAPRLGGASTNGFVSDYYYKKAGYIRMKTMSLGYNLPKSKLSKVKFENIRLFISGTNLITFDRLNKYNLDPESPSGFSGFYYPQQKTVSVGISITI